MGAQQAIFAADTAELEPLELTADLERPAPLCQLVAEKGGDRMVADPSIELSDDAIRQRSQEIWEREGRPEGLAQDHWERARAELAALIARTSTTHPAPLAREEDAVLPPCPEDDVVPPPCVEDDIAPPLSADSMAAETLSPAPSAAAIEPACDVLDDDGAREPEALQDITVSSPPDEIVSAAPRPMRLAPVKRSQQTGIVPSIICAGIVFRGALESSGDIQFDGTMEGDICCASLAVGEDAFIYGEILADEVIVRGRIRGCIRARRIYLVSGSIVEGAIHYGTLAVEDGAQIDGSFQCQEDPLALEAVLGETDVLPPQPTLRIATTETVAAA